MWSVLSPTVCRCWVLGSDDRSALEVTSSTRGTCPSIATSSSSGATMASATRATSRECRVAGVRSVQSRCSSARVARTPEDPYPACPGSSDSLGPAQIFRGASHLSSDSKTVDAPSTILLFLSVGEAWSSAYFVFRWNQPSVTSPVDSDPNARSSPTNTCSFFGGGLFQNMESGAITAYEGSTLEDVDTVEFRSNEVGAWTQSCLS